MSFSDATAGEATMPLSKSEVAAANAASARFLFLFIKDFPLLIEC
jgi:hypothetical protein